MNLTDIIALKENGKWKAYSSYQKAELLFNLTTEIPQKDVAKALSLHQSAISALSSAYKKACPKLRDAWAKGLIIDSAVITFARTLSPELQEKAIEDYLVTLALRDDNKEDRVPSRKTLEKVYLTKVGDLNDMTNPYIVGCMDMIALLTGQKKLTDLNEVWQAWIKDVG